MPWIPVPIIASLIGAGTTGITTGLEASGAIGGGGGGGTPQPTPAQISQQKAQQTSAVQQGTGNWIEQGNGGLSPNYLAWQTGVNTGSLNDISSLQDIANSMYGGSGGYGGTGGGGATTTMPTDLSINPTGTRPTLSDTGLTDLSIWS